MPPLRGFDICTITVPFSIIVAPLRGFILHIINVSIIIPPHRGLKPHTHSLILFPEQYHV